MKSFQRIKPVILSLVFISYACNDFEDVTPQSTGGDMSKNSVTQTKLGKQIENYYSVANMELALDSMRTVPDARFPDAVQVLGSIRIKTTDLYVRFLPKDSTQYDVLMGDTTMMLYDYPLDYEVIELENVYVDPALRAGNPNWLYTVVKPDRQLPGDIQHEVLSELFIPENAPGYDDAESDVFGTLSNVLARLDMVSRYMTDNLSEEELKQIRQIEAGTKTDPQARADAESPAKTRRKRSLWSWLLGSKWTPSGRIRVWDTNIGKSPAKRRVFSHYKKMRCSRRIAVYTWNTIRGRFDNGSYVPIAGVKVRARSFLKFRYGFTDSQGNFTVNGSFRSSARYGIHWQRYEFTIREGGILNTADMVGPKQKSPWNADIANGTLSQYHATIFRAAFHYYYGNIKGLRRPPKNSFWKPQMKLRAKYESNGQKSGRHIPYFRTLGIGSQIFIYNPHRPSQDTYGTVIHELAHAAHWNMDRSNYNQMNDCSETILGLYCSGDVKVAESWAKGVGWELTRMTYPDYLGRSWKGSGNNYTFVVADMIDDRNSDNTNYGFGYYSGDRNKDEVSGYTIRQIEDALKGCKTWNAWRDNIKNTYNNGTEDKLDKLFRAYE